ncbi:MAG: hypothetical protein LBV30_07490, partial [Propionibacteriaceae bacterium]|nr:hypothetical protein [Propionibacteriaceae bacterium]
MSTMSLVRRLGLALAAATLTLTGAIGLTSPASQAAVSDVVTSFTLKPTNATEQLAGKELAFTWSILTNAATDERVGKPVVKVTFPAGCVVRINPSTVGNSTPTVKQVGDQYEITWELPDITGGQSYEVPMVLSTSDGLCSNLENIPINAVLEDASNTDMPAASNPLNFTVKTGDPTIKATIPDMTGAVNPPVATVYGGKSNDQGKTLSTNPDELSWVPVEFAANWTTDPGGRDFETLTVRNELPEGALFDPAKNPGW